MATLTFNVRDRELFVDGTDIPLTQREWQVVTALVRSGRLTDVELGFVVWGHPYAGGFADLARFQIKNLRRKGVPIHTRRGLGYKLDGEIEVLDES